MADERELHDLLGAIYDAALDASQWEEALRRIARWIGLQGVFLVNEDREEQRAGIFKTYGFEADLLVQYPDWTYDDPGRPVLYRQPPGTAVATNLYYSRRDWRRTAYFNEFGRTHRIEHQLGMRIAEDARRVLWFGSARGIDDTPLTPADTAKLNALGPHLKRAVQIGSQFAVAQEAGALATAVLEGLPTGVVLLDEDARSLYANPAAERLLAGSRGASLRGRHLVADEPGPHDALRALVAGAVATGAGRGTSPGGRLLVEDAPVGERLVVHVFPCSDRRLPLDPAGRRVCAIVFLGRESDAIRPQPDVLRGLYGLTSAEARLAAALGEGTPLEEAADAFAISRHTARAQLRAVFQKTGVRRQADLLRLAHLLGAPPRPPGDGD